MERIVVVIEQDNLNLNAVEFACYLSEHSGSSITGAFLSRTIEISVAEDSCHRIKKTPEAVKETMQTRGEVAHMIDTADENIGFFKRTCKNRGVSSDYILLAPGSLVSESRYADILVITPELMKEGFESIPTKFVRALLKHAECPVIIAPEHLWAIDEIVFACDNHLSSMIAAKQFTYLFPEMREKKATVINIAQSSDGDFPGNHISDWLKVHYTDCDFPAARGEPECELFEYLMIKRNIFVVIGSSKRSLFGDLLKPSNGELIIKALRLPLFIGQSF